MVHRLDAAERVTFGDNYQSEGHRDHCRRYFRGLPLQGALSTPLAPHAAGQPLHTPGRITFVLPSLSSQGSGLHTLSTTRVSPQDF